MNNTEIKHSDSIAQLFGEAAESYHQEAIIPKKVSEGLISSLLPWREIIPDGPILEIGCGTGFLTKQLIEHFPEREFVITDASQKMLSFCENALKKEGLLTDKHRFELLDVDHFSADEPAYAMAIANFVPHWFKDAALGLERISEAIKPEGLLLCSFPGNHSFEQWYEHCLALGLPHTANGLPDVEEVVVKLSMGPLQIDYYENDIIQEFDSSLEFFRYLKNTGATYCRKGTSLTPKQFRLLLKHWDKEASGKVKIKWHTVYIAAKKDWE